MVYVWWRILEVNEGLMWNNYMWTVYIWWRIDVKELYVNGLYLMKDWCERTICERFIFDEGLMWKNYMWTVYIWWRIDVKELYVNGLYLMKDWCERTICERFIFDEGLMWKNYMWTVYIWWRIDVKELYVNGLYLMKDWGEITICERFMIKSVNIWEKLHFWLLSEPQIINAAKTERIKHFAEIIKEFQNFSIKWNISMQFIMNFAWCLLYCICEVFRLAVIFILLWKQQWLWSMGQMLPYWTVMFSVVYLIAISPLSSVMDKNIKWKECINGIMLDIWCWQ